MTLCSLIRKQVYHKHKMSARDSMFGYLVSTRFTWRSLWHLQMLLSWLHSNYEIELQILQCIFSPLQSSLYSQKVMLIFIRQNCIHFCHNRNLLLPTQETMMVMVCKMQFFCLSSSVQFLIAIKCTAENELHFLDCSHSSPPPPRETALKKLGFNFVTTLVQVVIPVVLSKTNPFSFTRLHRNGLPLRENPILHGNRLGI